MCWYYRMVPLILSLSKEMSGATTLKIFPLIWFDRLTMSGKGGIMTSVGNTNTPREYPGPPGYL